MSILVKPMKHRAANLKKWTAFAVGAATLGVAMPVLAQGSGLDLLDNLAKGEWTISFRDGSPDRKICVRTGRELIQLKHDDTGCARPVVEPGTNRVTVQYTCPGNGYGRTSIRRETATLVQIQSHGIASGMPFQIAGEARRTGTC